MQITPMTVAKILVKGIENTLNKLEIIRSGKTVLSYIDKFIDSTSF